MREMLCYVFALFFTQMLTASQDNNVNSLKKYSIEEKKTYLINSRKEGAMVMYDTSLVSSTKLSNTGKVLEEIIYADDESMNKRYIFKYDEKDRKIEEWRYFGNTVQKHMLYKYNEKGEKIEEYKLNEDGTFFRKIIYEYNELGKKILEKEIKPEIGEVSKVINNYDERGNLIEQKTVDVSNNVTILYLYKYDFKNNLLEEIRLDGQKQEWKFTYSYTTDNKIEKISHIYPFEKSNNHIIYKYDLEQNIIEESTYNYKNECIQKNSFLYVNGKLLVEEKNNETILYDYDVKGKIMEEKTMVNQKVVNVKKYNNRGEILSNEYYNQDIKNNYSEIYVYETVSGKLKEVSKLDYNKKLIYKTEYKHDLVGNLVEEINVGANLQIISKKITSYQYY